MFLKTDVSTWKQNPDHQILFDLCLRWDLQIFLKTDVCTWMKYPHNTYGWIYVSGEIFTDIIVLRTVPPRIIHGEQFSYP